MAEQTPAPAPPAPVGPSMAAFGGNESCPNCNARMAADQRYCLNCGHRRGDPRLPFMDAVVFMESMNAPGGGGAATPPPPPNKSGGDSRWNANAALIAGVATLVLAIGVGFLIGRSGHDNSQQAAAPQVIKVEGGGTGGGGGEEEAATEETTEESAGGGKKEAGKAKGKSKGSNKKSALKTEDTGKATKKAEENVKEGANGQTEAVEKVLHTEGGVKLETEVEVGGKCEEGAAGCSGGEFTGEFFGE
jgi:hypothetical protein